MSRKLIECVDWLNDNVYIDSPLYNDIIEGKMPTINFDNGMTGLLSSGCAIICASDTCYVLQENDGHWSIDIDNYILGDIKFLSSYTQNVLNFYNYVENKENI